LTWKRFSGEFFVPFSIANSKQWGLSRKTAGNAWDSMIFLPSLSRKKHMKRETPQAQINWFSHTKTHRKMKTLLENIRNAFFKSYLVFCGRGKAEEGRIWGLKVARMFLRSLRGSEGGIEGWKWGKSRGSLAENR
jgi:hypothetical protein